MLKRAFDIVASAVGLIVLAPFLLAIAALIKLASPGPVFYRGERIGRGGKPFRIFKFRTMVQDAERIGPVSATASDSRITRVGGFLRKYKLDECPQLLDVLRGAMSLVGPRPEVAKYVDMYTEEEQAILTVRPGITDWASIRHCHQGELMKGSEDADRFFEEKIRKTKVRLQLVYVRNHSLWVDLKILVYTFVRILNGRWLPPEIAQYGELE